MRTGKRQEAITYEERAGAVLIRVGGKAYENLRKIADVMNGVGWCDTDNTPATILAGFVVGGYLDNLATDTAYCGNLRGAGAGEVAQDIVDGIDTGFDSDTPEDKKRKGELDAAFRAAGL